MAPRLLETERQHSGLAEAATESAHSGQPVRLS